MKVTKAELAEKISALNTESNSSILVNGDQVYYKVFSAQWSPVDIEVEIQTSRIECEVIGIIKKGKTAKLKILKNLQVEDDGRLNIYSKANAIQADEFAVQRFGKLIASTFSR